MRLISILILTFVSCYCASAQTLDDIIVIGDSGIEQAIQSHLSADGFRYTAINHRDNFTVDSMGTSLSIEATPDNGNLFPEQTLSIIQYDSLDRYQKHISFMFYVNRSFNTNSTQVLSLLTSTDVDGNLLLAITFNGADSCDVINSKGIRFIRIYNQTLIDKTQLILCKMDSAGDIMWTQSLSNKTLHALGDSVSPYYNREFHTLTLGANGITTDIDMYDLYKPYLDTLTLKHSDGTEISIPIASTDIVLRFDPNGHLLKQFIGYHLKNSLTSESITILNAVSNPTSRFVLIKVNASANDTLVLGDTTKAITKGENVILIKYNAADEVEWSSVIGTQNSNIFYPPYNYAQVTLNFKLSFDFDQEDVILSFNYYYDNFNLTHNPFASATTNFNYNIATFRIRSINGSVKWYSVNGGDSHDDIVSATPYPPTKGIMLIGKTNSTNLVLGPFHNLNPYGYSNHFIFIAITDSMGNFIRLQTLNYALQAEFYSPTRNKSQQQCIGSSISYSNGTTYITGLFINQLDIKCKHVVANNTDGFILKLSAYNPPIDTEACFSLTSPSGKYVWDSTGTFFDTIPNSKGCDSLLVLNLKILQSQSILDSAVCKSMVSYSGKYVWDSTGTYRDTILNYKNCDSIITVHLTILQSKSALDSSVCSGMVSYSGKYIWDSSGTYYDTIPNYKGCDSIITLNLNVLRTSSTIDTTNCKAIVSPSGKYLWNVSGTYFDTIANTKTCDSIITIRFTSWVDSVSINLSACKQLTSPSGKYVLTSNGNYMDTLTSTKGCDSILFITYTQTNTTISLTRYFCDSLVSPSGKYVYHSSGLYWDTLTNVTGCDSVIELTLHYFPLVTSLTSSNDISCDTPVTHLNATGGSTYLWWPEEGLSNSTISNPTARLSQTTLLYVQISDSLGCTTTDSLTISVNKTETINNLANVFTPNNDGLNDCLKLSGITTLQSVTWKIFNRWGALVFESSNPDDCWNGQTLNGIDAENGTYYFTLTAKSSCETDIDQHGTILLIR